MNTFISLLMILGFALVVCLPTFLLIDKYFDWYSWFNINDDDDE